MRIHPGVSVVIPAKIDKQEVLVRTLRSIKSPLVREVIIVDDCSDVDIESWIYEIDNLPEYKLFVHRNQVNVGPSISRDRGCANHK